MSSVDPQMPFRIDSQTGQRIPMFIHACFPTSTDEARAWERVARSVAEFGEAASRAAMAYTELARKSTADESDLDRPLNFDVDDPIARYATAQFDESTEAMTLDELLGDDVAEMIRANKLPPRA